MLPRPVLTCISYAEGGRRGRSMASVSTLTHQIHTEHDGGNGPAPAHSHSNCAFRISEAYRHLLSVRAATRLATPSLLVPGIAAKLRLKIWLNMSASLWRGSLETVNADDDDDDGTTLCFI